MKTPQLFVLGVLVGFALSWIPFDAEFSPIQFSKKPPSPSVFTHHLPTSAPLLKREGYFLSYDGQHRNAHWVYHKVEDTPPPENTSRASCDFKEDPLIPEIIRATKKDYAQSGFDRGHLFAAADSSTQTEMEESFYLSNITPQTPAFNRGFWKRIENHIRSLAKEYKTVHVFSGPLYLSQKGRGGKRFVKYEVLGEHEVAVPTHFFSLIFVQLPSQKMLGKAYIVPNKAIDSKTPLKHYLTTVEEVEKASGVLFTHILD